MQDVALAAEVWVARVPRFLASSLTLPPTTAKRIERARAFANAELVARVADTTKSHTNTGALA